MRLNARAEAEAETSPLCSASLPPLSPPRMLRRRATRQPRRRRPSTPAVLLSIATTFHTIAYFSKTPTTITTVRATGVACSTDADCDNALGVPGSACVDAKCSNPFAAGCLKSLRPDVVLGGAAMEHRTCNSDDPPSAREKGDCVESPFDYSEIRILNQNWEAAMFMAWIMQILLSELVGVPVTIETGSTDRNADFYNPRSSFDYGTKGYNYDALKLANEIGDCREGEEGRPCAHVLPDAWEGQKSGWEQAEEEGYIEPVEGNGAVAKLGWYLPKVIARENGDLLSHFGLAGQENRHKLAKMFKRPTNWTDYCAEVSKDNCTTEDSYAKRAPTTESEMSSYFAGPDYRGYFRETAKNNCTADSNGCTGHIVDVPCEWSTFLAQQVHWNEVALESNGPLGNNNAYSYGQSLQVWRAADETNSSVLTYWYVPDPTVQEFAGTDYEFQQILLPTPTKACVKNRVSPDDRCSADPVERVGSELGKCDGVTHATQKYIVSSLYENNVELSDALQSPAYDLIKGIRISDLDINTMFDTWNNRGVDKWNHDPRYAVCSWVADNFDDLQRFVPRGYPREVRDGADAYEAGHLYTAMAFGALVALICVAVAALVYKRRKSKIMVYAQVNFLLFVLFGMFLVSIGGILTAIKPSAGSCTSQVWFLGLGYTLMMVPIIVKVSALNKLMQNARRMKRVKINPRDLYSAVGGLVLIYAVYLVVWTAVDHPKEDLEYRLTDEENENGGLIVEVDYVCSSSSDGWAFAPFLWQLLLLVVAAVLAFQSRNIRQEFNESRSLAFMVYSQFIFNALRLAVYILSDSFDGDVFAAVMSFLVSTDVIATVLIYFSPKLFFLKKDSDAVKRHSSMDSVVTPSRRNSNLSAYSEASEAGISSHRSKSSVETGVKRRGSSVSAASDRSDNDKTGQTEQSTVQDSGSTRRDSRSSAGNPPDEENSSSLPRRPSVRFLDEWLENGSENESENETAPLAVENQEAHPSQNV